jgi:hypothetical protein
MELMLALTLLPGLLLLRCWGWGDEQVRRHIELSYSRVHQVAQPFAG